MTLQINNAPAVKAYCEQRITELELRHEVHRDVKIFELNLVVKLIDGLEMQSGFLGEALSGLLPKETKEAA